MSNAAALQQPDIFAANRARGVIAIGAGATGGVTRRTTVREEGSLRVRFPGPVAPALQAVLVNTAGGTAGGDRYDIACQAGAGADLTVSTAAAEKIYRSTGANAEVLIKLDVGAGSSMAWLPQETIFFDEARLTRRIDVTLAEDASVLIAEAVVFGRSAMGKQSGPEVSPTAGACIARASSFLRKPSAWTARSPTDWPNRPWRMAISRSRRC